MKQKVTYQTALALSFLGIGLLLFVLGCNQATMLLSACNTTETFIIKDDNVSSEKVADAFLLNADHGQPYSMVFWTQDDNVATVNTLSLRQHELSIVQTVGDSYILFPQFNLAMVPKDWCLISAGATHEVAGNPGNTGLELTVANKKYRAAHMLPSEKAFLVMPANDETVCDRLTVSLNVDESVLISDRTVAAHLGIDISHLDFKVLSLINFVLLMLPPILLTVFLAMLARRYSRDDFSRWLSGLAFFMSGVGVIVAMFAFTNIISMFSDYFPTQWSSSEEWSTLWADFVSRIHLLFTSPVYEPDEWYYQVFFTSIGYTVAALICLLTALCFYQNTILLKKAKHIAKRNKETRAIHNHTEYSCLNAPRTISNLSEFSQQKKSNKYSAKESKRASVYIPRR